MHQQYVFSLVDNCCVRVLQARLSNFALAFLAYCQSCRPLPAEHNQRKMASSDFRHFVSLPVTIVYLWASYMEQLQVFPSVSRRSRARNSNHCQQTPSTTHKAISTAVLSSLYKPIISFLLVLKQAYVSWKYKKKQITSNLNPVLFSGDSFKAHKDKRGATGRDFIMCLSISKHKRSSKAEWNEEPWAYVFKSQLSQGRISLYN